MEQVIFGGYYTLLDDTVTEYNSLAGGYSWEVTESRASQVVSADGLIKQLRVKLSGAPGAGKHYDFTLTLNGAPTALTLEIADAATLGNNMVNKIDIAPGDTISLECNPDNTPTEVYATWTCVFEGDTANESLILGKSFLTLDDTNIEYCQVMCGASNLTVVENDWRQVVPTAGTIKDFYVELNVDPGTAPDAYRFTVRLNGATVAQSLIVTITANATTGSDLAHNLVVAAGDVLTMMVEPLNTPSVEPYAFWGMTFVADIDGESVVLGGSADGLPDAATEYYYLTALSASFVWDANETIRYQLGQVCTLKKLYILLSAAPGAGNTYTFTLRIAGANSNVITAVADAATTGNSAALEDTVANDEYVDLQVVPDDTPNAADSYWGFVSFREVGWTGKISGVVNPAKIMGVAVADIATVKGVA